MRTHNIGGSILPSSCPQILQPMAFHGKVLQVVPDYEADTHRLVCDGAILASHPNGYSCHALAARMIAGDAKRVQAQAQYIVDCAGSADFAAVSSLLSKATTP